jgi:hypothetical protein
MRHREAPLRSPGTYSGVIFGCGGFCIHKSYGDFQPFAHIEHQRRAETDDADSIFAPHTRINDTRRAIHQQLQPERLRDSVGIRVKAIREISGGAEIVKLVPEIGELIDIRRDFFLHPSNFL